MYNNRTPQLMPLTVLFKNVYDCITSMYSDYKKEKALKKSHRTNGTS